MNPGSCAPACRSPYGFWRVSRHFSPLRVRSSSRTGWESPTFARTPCRRSWSSWRSRSCSSATGVHGVGTRPAPCGSSRRASVPSPSTRTCLTVAAPGSSSARPRLSRWCCGSSSCATTTIISSATPGRQLVPSPKFGALWLVAPRLTARAWVVAARRRISTVDESVAYAEVWRAVYEDSRTAKVRRTLARRTAWRSVAEAAGGVWAELPRTAEVAAVDVIRRGQGPEPGSLEGPRIERQAVAAAAPTFPDPPTPVNGSSHPQLPSAPRSSLRDRVFALLDEQFSTEEALDIDDDDPYVLWMTSRALNVDADDVADFVREWRRQAASRVRVQAPR